MGCLTALHKTIRNIYDSTIVRIVTVLTIVGVVTLFCVVSIADNFGYKFVLEVRHKINKVRMENSIIGMKTRLDNVYKEIGQNVYNKQQVDGLMSQALEYNTEISLRQNEAFLLEEKFKEDVRFENILKDLCSTKVSTRRGAIRSLATAGKKESMPYLALCSIDTNPIIREEAIASIGLLNQQQVLNAQDPDTLDEGILPVLPLQMSVPESGQNQSVMPLNPGTPAGTDTVQPKENQKAGGDF
jgi:hypothetical protein